MENDEGIKELVKEKYAQIARRSTGASCCCGTDSGRCPDYSTFSDDYTKPAGYNPDADLRLGCGIPIPVTAQTAAELYAGCIAGALLKEESLALIKDTGFKNIKVVLEKPLNVPEDLLKHLSAAECGSLDRSKPLALSITIYGEKP